MERWSDRVLDHMCQVFEWNIPDCLGHTDSLLPMFQEQHVDVALSLIDARAKAHATESEVSHVS